MNRFNHQGVFTLSYYLSGSQAHVGKGKTVYTKGTSSSGNIKAVAAKAGVSVGTVSNVLSGSARVSPEFEKRVLLAIRQLNYRPNHIARSLKRNSTRLLGMVISDIANPFFPYVVRGAEDAAMERDYVLVTLNSDDRVDRELQLFSVLGRHRVDGILLVPASDRELNHVRALSEDGTPIVMLDRVPEDCSWDSVSVDNAVGAQRCVDYLISLGHRDIGLVSGAPHLVVSAERLRGYRNSLRIAKIPYRAGLVARGDFSFDTAYRVTRELLAKERPSALFVSNHVMSMGSLKAIHELNLKIPKDVSFLVFDDMQFFESMSPPITALSQPMYEMGRKAAELLIRRIEGTAEHPTHVVMETELKVRGSCRSLHV